MKSNKAILVILVLTLPVSAVADVVTLPAVISPNMVLQQQIKVPIWGFAKPGERVTVSGSWDVLAIASTKADADGKWMVKIPTAKASNQKHTLTVAGRNTIKLKNILIGEVWVCSGQSNMEMSLRPVSPWHNGAFNYETEIAGANYPNIRLFTVAKKIADTPQDDCVGAWSKCSPETIGPFSAVAYFFARKVHNETGLPIGLIHTSWGGTPAQAWTSERALKKLPDFAPIIEKLKNRDYEKAKKQFEQDLADWWKFAEASDLGMANNWSDASTNTSDWKTMAIPQVWEQQDDMKTLDGSVWFKKTVDIPQSWAGKELVLKTGPIDDMDTTWVNGQQVGKLMKLGFWDRPRTYKVPASIIKTGENEITVRVIDNHGGGGIYGNPDQYTIAPADKSADPINIAGDWKYNIGLDLAGKPQMPTSPTIVKNQHTPTMLYNGMLAPIIPYGIKGAIWYQGESNAGSAYQYRTLLPAMIVNWRTDWDQGDFPFYFTQIAPFNYGIEGICPELQEAQLMTLSLINTGMAVTTDIGNVVDIHPRNKQMVGKRLALWALAKDYGQKDLVYSGPLYKYMQVEGDKIRIFFDHVGSGLFSLGGNLKHFTIAGPDKKFVEATAEIDNNTVVTSRAKVKKPLSVRYAWKNEAVGNLYNFDMLPASPFRTDDWPGVTFKK